MTKDEQEKRRDDETKKLEAITARTRRAADVAVRRMAVMGTQRDFDASEALFDCVTELEGFIATMRDEQEKRRDDETKNPSKAHGPHGRVWHWARDEFYIPACDLAGLTTQRRDVVTCPDCLAIIGAAGAK